MTNFELKSPRAQLPIRQSPFHHWGSPGGAPWTLFFRFETSFLLRFPKAADFQVSMDGCSITCWPAPGEALSSIQHLYLSQVLPLALSQSGKAVFHASAIEVEGGVIAFMGESGRGKSTLAASFAINGKRFLSDDGLIIELKDKAFIAIPSHPHIRLFKDSQETFFPATANKAPVADFNNKLRLQFDGDLIFCDRPGTLRLVYFLGNGCASEVEIYQLTPAKAHIELVKHSFLLEVEKKSMLAQHFALISQLANQLEFYQLDFTRDFKGLDQVRQTVLQHAQTRYNHSQSRA